MASYAFSSAADESPHAVVGDVDDEPLVLQPAADCFRQGVLILHHQNPQSRPPPFEPVWPFLGRAGRNLAVQGRGCPSQSGQAGWGGPNSQPETSLRRITCGPPVELTLPLGT